MDSINNGTLLKWGPYKHVYDEERAQIGRYAADHGVAAAVRHYQKLKKAVSTRGEVKEEGKIKVAKKLPYKERGRQLLLGDYLDGELLTFAPHLQ